LFRFEIFSLAFFVASSLLSRSGFFIFSGWLCLWFPVFDLLPFLLVASSLVFRLRSSFFFLWLRLCFLVCDIFLLLLLLVAASLVLSFEIFFFLLVALSLLSRLRYSSYLRFSIVSALLPFLLSWSVTTTTTTTFLVCFLFRPLLLFLVVVFLCSMFFFFFLFFRFSSSCHCPCASPVVQIVPRLFLPVLPFRSIPCRQAEVLLAVRVIVVVAIALCR